jgi:protein-L-isoaspartate(D-aspartate) O-methyltransferase
MSAVNAEQARFNMIEQQIRPWEVLDQRVLRLFEEVPREAFVPEAYRNLAFADIEIPLGQGETMMSPKVEGRMLQALAVHSGDRVLEVGTGSGFVTACLARLADEVTSIEIDETLAEQARARLGEQGADNVVLRSGDALAMGEETNTYDAIAVTGSLPLEEQAEVFKRSLTLGGRLFLVLGEAPVMQAVLITRVGQDQYTLESLFETELPALRNARRPERFSF